MGPVRRLVCISGNFPIGGTDPLSTGRAFRRRLTGLRGRCVRADRGRLTQPPAGQAANLPGEPQVARMRLHPKMEILGCEPRCATTQLRPRCQSMHLGRRLTATGPELRSGLRSAMSTPTSQANDASAKSCNCGRARCARGNPTRPRHPSHGLPHLHPGRLDSGRRGRPEGHHAAL